MVDIEKLINEIYLRTPIWDQTNSKHHNRELIFTLWQEIANECGITSDVAKTKWKSLRDNFRAEWKKIRGKGKSGDANTSPSDHESKWVWFKNLLFLKDQMAARKMSTSLRKSLAVASCTQIEDSQVDSGNDYLDGVVNEVEEENTDAEYKSSVTVNQNIPAVSRNTNYTKRKRNGTDTNELLNMERKKIQLVESHFSPSSNIQNSKSGDDLYYFLMSLHKPLSELPNERQMFTRIKMQELIYNEIINKNQNMQAIANGQFGQNSAVQNNSFIAEADQNTQYLDPPSVSSVYSYASTSTSIDNDFFNKK